MSVWVYKGSEKELIPAEQLEPQIKSGWSVDDPANAPKIKEVSHETLALPSGKKAKKG